MGRVGCEGKVWSNDDEGCYIMVWVCYLNGGGV